MASVPHTNQYGGSIIFSPKIGIWQPKLTSAVEWYDSSKGWFFNIHGVLYTATKQSYAILKTKGRVDAQLTKSFFKDQSLKISLMAKDIFHTAYHNFNIYGKQTYRASRNYPDQHRPATSVAANRNLVQYQHHLPFRQALRQTHPLPLPS